MLMFYYIVVTFAEPTTTTKPKPKAFWEDWEPSNQEPNNNTKSIVPDSSDKNIDKGNNLARKIWLTFFVIQKRRI